MFDAASSPAPADAGTSPDNTIMIACGTFRMGSDDHYPEEAPAHRVSIDSFFIDATPVTNRQCEGFVKATRHVTFASFRT